MPRSRDDAARLTAYREKKAARMPQTIAERKARRIHFQRMRTLEIQIVVYQLKREPCADCGRRFEPVCMDFDHRPGVEKFTNVSRLIGSGTVGLAGVLAEIAKCDLVCACCHRLRTQARSDNDRVMNSTAALGAVN